MKSLIVTLLLMLSFDGICQNGKPAAELFQTALSKAKTSKKNIILVFTSSWCGPCKEFRKLIHDEENKAFFEKNYVVLELYNSEIGEKKINENLGTDSLILKYDADTSSIPFWLILNSSGVKIFDGYEYIESAGIRSRSNSGFSLHPDYLKEFLVKIKKTSKLSDMEIDMIRQRGRQLAMRAWED